MRGWSHCLRSHNRRNSTMCGLDIFSILGYFELINTVFVRQKKVRLK